MTKYPIVSSLAMTLLLAALLFYQQRANTDIKVHYQTLSSQKAQLEAFVGLNGLGYQFKDALIKGSVESSYYQTTEQTLQLMEELIMEIESHPEVPSLSELKLLIVTFREKLEQIKLLRAQGLSIVEIDARVYFDMTSAQNTMIQLTHWIDSKFWKQIGYIQAKVTLIIIVGFQLLFLILFIRSKKMD